LCETYGYSGIDTSISYDFTVDTDETYFEWAVNSFVYVSVIRYDTYNATCQYTLKATISSCAALGPAVTLAADNDLCLPYFNATLNFPLPLYNISSIGQYIGQITVPLNTAFIKGTINSTTPNLNLYGANYGVPTSSNYDCYVPSSQSVGGFYIYVLDCFVPRAGPFYFWLFDSSIVQETFNAFLLLQIDTCTAGHGGPACTDVVSVFTSTDVGKTFVLAGDATRYFSIDFTPGETFSINCTTNSSAIFGIRKNGFFGDYSGSDGRGYEDLEEYQGFSDIITKTLVAEDTTTGGTWYFGVSNPSSTNAISFSFTTATTNPTVAPTTQGPVATTDKSSHHSSAILVSIPSFLLAAFFALLSVL